MEGRSQGRRCLTNPAWLSEHNSVTFSNILKHIEFRLWKFAWGQKIILSVYNFCYSLIAAAESFVTMLKCIYVCSVYTVQLCKYYKLNALLPYFKWVDGKMSDFDCYQFLGFPIFAFRRHSSCLYICAACYTFINMAILCQG